MSGIEQVNKDVDHNLQILDGEYDFSSSMQVLSEAQNGKEKKEKEHPLQEWEFNKYFEGNNFYKQSNIGNCWIVAALDSITHLSNYKNLVMQSIKVTKDGFKIRLPMGAPKGYSGAKEYTTYVKPEKQRQANSTVLELLSFNQAEPDKIKKQYGKNSRQYRDELKKYEEYQKKLEENPWHDGVGLHCMVHAFGQYVTGKNTFNYGDLTFGPTGSVLPFEEFVYGLSAETQYYSSLKINTKPLENVLKGFNPQKQTLTVMVKTNDDYEIMEEFNPHVGVDMSYWPDHVVSVDHVEMKGGVPQIYISDPHSASDASAILGPYTFNKFVKMIGGYTIASFDEKKYLEGSNLKPLQRYWTNHLALGRSGSHNNATTQSTVEGSRSYWDPVSWINLCGSRGDVLVTDLDSNSGKGKKKDIKITGWNQDMQIIDNGTSVKMQILGKQQTLELNNSCFKTEYDENGNSVYYYDSACRIALFVERMFSEYIIPQRGSKKSPFKLHSSGDIEFDIKPNGESWQFLTTIAQSGSNLVNKIADNMPAIIDRPVNAVADRLNAATDRFNGTIIGDAISDAVDYVGNQALNAAERASDQFDNIHREIDSDVTVLSGTALMNSLGLKDDRVAKQKIVDFLNDLYNG